VVIGLVGYAWRIRIGQPLMWQVVFAGQALWAFMFLAATAQVLLPSFPKATTWGQFAFAALLISFLVLSSVALFRYAFRENLWAPGETN
jgi:hypothetical protein